MSRIGKLPVSIPAGVTITVEDGNVVTVKGPKGTLTEKVSSEMVIEQDAGVLTVKRPSDDKRHRALHGLTRTIINNMVTGTTNGFEKKLEIVGVGYKVQPQGTGLVINVGYSHPVNFAAPAGISHEIPSGPPERVTYGVSADEAHRFGLPCGGTLELLLEFNPDASTLADLVQRLSSGRMVERLHLEQAERLLHKSRQISARKDSP